MAVAAASPGFTSTCHFQTSGAALALGMLLSRRYRDLQRIAFRLGLLGGTKENGGPHGAEREEVARARSSAGPVPMIDIAGRKCWKSPCKVRWGVFSGFGAWGWHHAGLWFSGQKLLAVVTVPVRRASVNGQCRTPWCTSFRRKTAFLGTSQLLWIVSGVVSSAGPGFVLILLFMGIGRLRVSLWLMTASRNSTT